MNDCHFGVVKPIKLREYLKFIIKGLGASWVPRERKWELLIVLRNLVYFIPSISGDLSSREEICCRFEFFRRQTMAVSTDLEEMRVKATL